MVFSQSGIFIFVLNINAEQLTLKLLSAVCFINTIQKSLKQEFLLALIRFQLFFLLDAKKYSTAN